MIATRLLKQCFIVSIIVSISICSLSFAKDKKPRQTNFLNNAELQSLISRNHQKFIKLFPKEQHEEVRRYLQQHLKSMHGYENACLVNGLILPCNCLNNEATRTMNCFELSSKFYSSSEPLMLDYIGLDLDANDLAIDPLGIYGFSSDDPQSPITRRGIWYW